MSVKPFFLDTNILVYGYSSQDPSKREIAQRLITSGFAVTSVQTLNELCNVLRRKFPGAYANAEQILKELLLSTGIPAHRGDNGHGAASGKTLSVVVLRWVDSQRGTGQSLHGHIERRFAARFPTRTASENRQSLSGL